MTGMERLIQELEEKDRQCIQKRMSAIIKVKKPNHNVYPKSCVRCRDKLEFKYDIEYSPDWYTYMCVKCMEEHAKRFGHEIEEK
jgi:hypothetical protein